MSDKTQWPEISIWKYVCTFTIADRNLILTILFTPLLIYLGDYELTDKVGGQRSHIHGTISPYRQVQYSRMIDIRASTEQWLLTTTQNCVVKSYFIIKRPI